MDRNKIRDSICQQKQSLSNRLVVLGVMTAVLFMFGLMSTTPLLAQETAKEISGVVLDNNKEPVLGAAIQIKGTTVGTLSDIDGKYSLKAKSGDLLICAFVGLDSEEITVGSSNTINFNLGVGIIGIDEVVAIGYGTQKRKDLTGSIATVNSDKFNKGAATSPEQLLQGKVAGVNITSSSGEPGAAQSVTIRGPGSIRSGNSPLYVIDGVPMTSSSPSSGGEDVGFGSQSARNPMNFINPGDIASIDVLKDASAAAIYGARGSNGVIIITTKTGKKGKARASFSSDFTVGSIANKIDLLSAEEFTDFHTEKGTTGYIGTADTDWQDQIFRNSTTQNHKLSISNGTANSNYYASVSYLSQEGLIKESALNRYTGRINADQSMWDDNLKVGISLTASYIEDFGVPVGDSPSADGDLITNALIMNPTDPVYNSDGSFYDKDGMVNPVALLDLYSDEANTTRVLGNIDASLNLYKGLTYKVNVGVDNSMSTRNIQLAKHSYIGIDASPEGRLYVKSVENRGILIDNILSYDLELDKLNQSLKFLLGHSYQYFYYRTHGYGVSNLSTSEIDPIYNPGIGGEVSQSNGDWPSGGASIDELQSLFGRVNYSLNDKYLLTGTVRYDGSSRFGDNNKYGLFPSLSGAWRIKEESFMDDLDAIHNLKLRVGWGQTGNQEVPNKQSLSSVTSDTSDGTGYSLDNGTVSPGIKFVRNANPDLKWEVVAQTNIGLDFALFSGKLYGSVDYFKKVTTDALLQVDVVDPLESAGGSTTWENLEDTKIVNNGWEFDLGYQGESGAFGYTIGANAAILKNEIQDLQGVYYTGSLGGPGLSNEVVMAYLSDESVGSFYLPEFLGFDSDGNSQYTGADGNNKLGSEVTTDDYIVAGTAIPKLTYSFFGTLNYKSFDLSLNFNGVSGNKIYNCTANAYFRRPFLIGGNNVEKRLLEKYPEEGDTNVDKPSTRYLENGSFLRLNNASLSYNINMSKVKYIDNLKVYFTGSNLFVITDYSGYDPEVNTNKNVNGVTAYGIDSSSYPKARTYMFGLNVSF